MLGDMEDSWGSGWEGISESYRDKGSKLTISGLTLRKQKVGRMKVSFQSMRGLVLLQSLKLAWV